MGTGVALDDEKRERIKALLTMGKSKNLIAKEVGVSWATVDKISKEEPDELESLREEKREELIDVIYDDMKQALALGRQKIKLAQAAAENFDGIMEKLTDALTDANANPKDIMDMVREVSSVMSIPLGQISTYFGTLYDKRALMKGDPTASTNINGSMTVKQDLKKLSPEELRNLENILGKVADTG